MPCNAWNHPANCDCGWGGVYYGPEIAISTLSRSDIVRSFVNPNATCPVCGDNVFYFQSISGGRVFFDDIGWPWPKHSCTDSNNPSKRGCRSEVRQLMRNRSGKNVHLLRLMSAIKRQNTKVDIILENLGTGKLSRSRARFKSKIFRDNALEELGGVEIFVVDPDRFDRHGLWLEFVSRTKRCLRMLNPKKGEIINIPEVRD